MLYNINGLYGTKLAALDGEIGQARDFYFDDQTWMIRYLVADTGSWLASRLVLLSPHSFANLRPHEKTLPVMLRKRQIEGSPSIESHQPVSRHFEIEYYRHYGWPAYWNDGASWDHGAVRPPSREQLESAQPRRRDDKHLQSTRAVTGYHIQTNDGIIGRVSDFLVDQRNWAIRELAVDAGHWYAGKEILIPIAKIEQISYEASTVFVSLTKADIGRTGAHEVVRAGASSQSVGNFAE